MSGLQLKMLMDASSVIKGSKDIAGATDKVIDSLDELARESQTAGDQVTGDLEGIAREGDTAAEKLERDMRDAFDSVKRESKQAGDVVSREARTSFDDAGEASKDFKSEVRSNFAEMGASATGSVEDAANTIQGTLAGLAMSPALGPYGLLAGAFALAFGAIWSSANANAEKTKQTVQDMYDDLIESGNNFVSQSFIQQKVAAIFQGAEDAAVGLEQLRAEAKLLGADEGQLAAAYAGDMDARKALLDQVGTKLADLNEQQRKYTEEHHQGNLELSKEQNKWIELKQNLEAGADAAQDAADRATGYRNAMSWVGDINKEIREQHDALGAVYDQLGAVKQAASNMPNPTIKVDVDVDDVRTQITTALRRSFPIGVTVGTRYGQGIQ